MAWKTGTATDYKDLLEQLIAFATGQGTSTAPTGTRTGNGTLEDFTVLEPSDTENWTLNVTNATKIGVSNYTTPVAVDTPVLHWRMNATSGVTEQDTTANNLDGTIVGTPTLAVTGLLSVDTDTAMTFDGIDDQVKSAADSLVQLTDADKAIEVTINPSSLTGTQFLAGVGAAGTTNADNYLISLWMEEGYLKILHEYSTGVVESTISGYKLVSGRTYQLILSHNAANKTYTLLNGGIEVFTWNYVFPSSDGTNSYFMVGMDADGNSPFTGTIDEAVFYDSVISSATAVSHAKDALGHETFSVTGSVSGAQIDAYAGVPYEIAEISFLILDGTTNFILNDDFIVAATTGTLGIQAWIVNRREKETVFLEGPGLAASDNIHIIINTYEDSGADYFNWKVTGHEGYVTDQDADNQVNVSPPSYVPLMDASMTYWFVVSGRRIIVIAKTSTNYHGCYLGLYLPFATPTQNPYPLFIGGSTGISTARWSNTSFVRETVNTGTSLFVDPMNGCAYVRHIDGSYSGVANTTISGGATNRSDYYLSPYMLDNFNANNRGAELIREDLSGDYLMLAITLIDSDVAATSEGILGELDGIYHVSGFGNAAENIVDDGTRDHLVVQNTFRTTIDAYAALRLE